MSVMFPGSVLLLSNPFSGIWNALLDLLTNVIHFYGKLLVGIEPYNWGFAIILLTITVRLLMMPLAIKQTKEMEKVQALSPKLQELQKRYKVDRSMMRTDPDKYRQIQEKLRNEQAKLYKENNANPVGSCLPLFVQMPVFLALFNVLRTNQDVVRVPEMVQAPFFLIDTLGSIGIAGGIGSIILIIGQGVTIYLTQKITMARNPAAMEGPAASMQNTMLYFMPVMLMFFALSMPAGLLLYWVASNLWTIGQTLFIYRFVSSHNPKADPDEKYKPAKPTDKKK